MINILIADDNIDNRTVLHSLLDESENVQIFEASNGQEALESCQIKQMDLVFMDIMMPVMNGFEATRQIKELHEDTMVIALSALNDDNSRNQMLDCGAEDYITKPVNPELFLSRLKNYTNIIGYRKEPVMNLQAKNPFSKNIFSRFTQFVIHSEQALAEFWDFWLKGQNKEVDDLSDYIRLIYALGDWILKQNENCAIIYEENSTHIYLIQSNIDALSKKVLVSIMDKHLPKGGKYVVYQGNLIIEIPKILSIHASDEAPLIPGKISAKEYVQKTPFDFMDKLDILEDLELQIEQEIAAIKKSSTQEGISTIANILQSYGDTIELLAEFAHLAVALESMSQYLLSLNLQKLDSKKQNLLASALITFLDDLSSWRLTIFIEQNSVDIHYMDDSLLNACLQMEALLEEESDISNDIEFF